ncbi:hypothetical protein MMPV_008386 [Pyropia vietnamensis]
MLTAPPFFRPLPVLSVATLVQASGSPAPHGVATVKRLTLGLPPSQSLASWVPSDHLKVLVPRGSGGGRRHGHRSGGGGSGGGGGRVLPVKPRSYSPTSPRERAGSLDLTFKVYAGGVASTYLDRLCVGDTLRVAGPVTPAIARPRRRGWGGAGGGQEKRRRVLGIVALGIGITGALPILVDELARGPGSGGGPDAVALVHAVRAAVEARVCADELAAAARGSANRLSVHRIASGEAVDGWARGRVNAPFLSSVVVAAAAGGLSAADGGAICERDGVSGDAAAASSPLVRWVVVGSKAQMRSVWDVLGGMGYPRWSTALYLKTIVPRGGGKAVSAAAAK